jgi:hypothetical protein
VSSNLAGCAIYYNISGRYDQLSPASRRSGPFRKPHGRTVTGFGGFWTSPILWSAAYRCVNEPPRPRIPRARTREPDRSDPAADGIGHRLIGGPPSPAGSPGPAPIPGPSARPPEPGAGAFPPAGGSWDPIAHGSPLKWARKPPKTASYAKYRSQDLSALQVMPYSPSPCVPQFHRPSVQANPPGYSRQYPGVKVAPLVG